jgi:hypothetical protein
MLESEVVERLNNGESAALIAVDQWSRMKVIVIQLKIKTGQQLEKLLTSDKIVLWCAVCENYESCEMCILPKADNGYVCRCTESVYNQVMQAEDHKSLVSAIDLLIETLKQASVIENLESE